MKRKVLLGSYILLTIIGIICALYKLLTVNTSMQMVVAIATLIMFACVMAYVGVAYKKPHGNVLRYTMLAFAFSLVFDLNFCIYLKAKHFFIVAQIVMLLAAYISGRLDKINENKVLCTIVTIGLIYMWLNTSKSAHSLINTSLSQLILWFDLCLAYCARYGEHKESGKEFDSKENH